MSKALDQAIERLDVGTTIVVVESSYRPELVGTTRTITARLSRRLFACTSSHDPTCEHGMELPPTKLAWLDADTFTYPLRGRPDHHMTLRIV